MLDQGASSARAENELDWRPTHPGLVEEFRQWKLPPGDGRLTCPRRRPPPGRRRITTAQEQSHAAIRADVGTLPRRWTASPEASTRWPTSTRRWTSAEAPWPRLKRARAFAADLHAGRAFWTSVAGTGCRRPANWRCATRSPALTSPSSRSLGRRRTSRRPCSSVATSVRSISRQRAFDAIVALYLIDNIARDDYPVLFRRFGELLRPNGRLLLSAEPGEDPCSSTRGWACRCSSTRYPPNGTRAAAPGAGLSVVSTERSNRSSRRPADRVRLDHR